MEDRFKFKAIVKGYYYIDTPDKCEEFEPLISLENIDVLDIGDIGISEEDLEIAIRKQYPDLQDVYIERIMENFIDNSHGIDTYITITPERVYQCTGLKDKNGKLIFEGDIVKDDHDAWHYVKWVYDSWQLFPCTQNNYTIGIVDDEIELIGNRYENPELLED